MVSAFAFKLDLKNLVALITTFILGSKASEKLERRMSSQYYPHKKNN